MLLFWKIFAKKWVFSCKQPQLISKTNNYTSWWFEVDGWDQEQNAGHEMLISLKKKYLKQLIIYSLKSRSIF